MANHLPGKVLKITIEWRDEGVLLKKYDVVMEQATAKELYLEAASKARMPVAGPIDTCSRCGRRGGLAAE